MELGKKIELLENMLEIEAGNLTCDMRLSEIEEWDSLAMISLIALLDDKFNKKVTGKTIKAFTKIQDILEVME